jgi:hypothetical protein
MHEAIPPLPQYTFMAWCSVKKITGTTLPLPRCGELLFAPLLVDCSTLRNKFMVYIVVPVRKILPVAIST